MKRYLILFLSLLAVGGCETASQSAIRHTDLRLFVDDLNRSMEAAAAEKEGHFSSVIYRRYSDRPFKDLPTPELVEVGMAQNAIDKVYNPGSTLPAGERSAVLSEYAAKGVPLAQFAWGGEILLRTHESALGAEYVRRSALQGCPPAQALLSYLYWKGIGLSRDKTRAYGWADSASYAGLDSATRLRAEIGPALNPAQLQEAKAISAAWRQQ
ncbi:MAG: SEL1-like repeat protein [Rhodospirillales bacterium]|nr:SEL1-like repeat protein [Rhodospirillales bacterium]